MANTKLPARLLDTSAIPALNVTGDLTVDTTTLKVDSTNNRVGIGIASPATPLDIMTTGANQLYIRNTDNSAQNNAIVSLRTGGYSNIALDGATVDLKIGGSSKLHVDASGNVGIGGSSHASGRLLVTNGGTNQVVLKGASGTTNLNMGNFVGGGYISNNYYYSSGHQADDNSKGAFEVFIGDSSYDINYHSAGAMGSRRRDFHITDTGKVGMGTNGPAAKLHVYNSSGGDATNKAGMLSEAVLKLQPHATNSTNMLVAQVDGGSSMGIQVTNGPATANWDLSLSPFGGNVGIATVNPAYALEVKKSVDGDWLSRIYNTGTTAGQGLLVRSDTADSQAPVVLGVYSGGSYKMFVRGDGTVTQPHQPTAIYTHSTATEDGAYGHNYGVTSGAASVYCRPQTAIVNRGNMYTPSNGRFTAPQAGVYRYAVHGNLYTVGITSTAYWTVRVWKNTSHYVYHYEANQTRAAGSWVYANVAGTIEMAANDYLRFQLVTNAKGGQNNHFGWDLANYTHYEFQLLY